MEQRSVENLNVAEASSSESESYDGLTFMSVRLFSGCAVHLVCSQLYLSSCQDVTVSVVRCSASLHVSRLAARVALPRRGLLFDSPLVDSAVYYFCINRSQLANATNAPLACAPTNRDGCSAGSHPAASADAAVGSLCCLQHMIAGALAGVTEHIAMYPIDTIKTRMQALSHPGQRLHRSTLRTALSAVIRREGISGLYQGIGAVAVGAGPAHALYFAIYELAKDVGGGNDAGGNLPLAAACAGATATLVNDACMTPADVIKQRLQVAHSPYKGILDCATTVMRQEGWRAFFKSYPTTIVMNIPFTAIHFSVYESAKRFLRIESEQDEETLAVQLLAGGVAGGSAAAVTNPLDVVKTRLQTEGVHSSTKYSASVVATLRKIVQEEGAQAVWRGLQPRVLFHVPAAAVCWGTYETVKGLLSDKGAADKFPYSVH